MCICRTRRSTATASWSRQCLLPPRALCRVAELRGRRGQPLRRAEPGPTSHQRRHKPPVAAPPLPAVAAPSLPPWCAHLPSDFVALPLPPDAAPPPPSCRASIRDADALPLPLDAAFLDAPLLVAALLDAPSSTTTRLCLLFNDGRRRPASAPSPDGCL